MANGLLNLELNEMSEQSERTELENMKVNEQVYVNWFEEGGAEVTLLPDGRFAVGEVKQYGGEGESIEEAEKVDTIDQVIELAYSWT